MSLNIDHIEDVGQPVVDSLPQVDEKTAAKPDTAKNPFFILYMDGPDYGAELGRLVVWVNRLLVPVYCRETTSQAPWCAEWWKHTEAVAQLHGLWLAWQELTGAEAELTGPASWHRDFLTPVLDTLRDSLGPFAGCKADMHRDKMPPHVEYP
nr:DUF4913 domain-containing protein [Kibdelosporangium sp. MJ126-NF4]CEL15620.1 hypothetical protein [Kibdelosporangium sp. MJ126-NF4]CTQ90341.1 hypothetical protein [Kibdelosporangium sp. MJ126-NF4]